MKNGYHDEAPVTCPDCGLNATRVEFPGYRSRVGTWCLLKGKRCRDCGSAYESARARKYAEMRTHQRCSACREVKEIGSEIVRTPRGVRRECESCIASRKAMNDRNRAEAKKWLCCRVCRKKRRVGVEIRVRRIGCKGQQLPEHRCLPCRAEKAIARDKRVLAAKARLVVRERKTRSVEWVDRIERAKGDPDYRRRWLSRMAIHAQRATLTADEFKRWNAWRSRLKRRSDYDRNRATVCAKQAEASALRAEKARDFVYRYFLTHPCVDCGETDPRVLEFDHRDPAEKSFSISSKWGKMVSATLLAEIEKCDVRCANCHRKRTAAQYNTWRHKRAQGQMEFGLAG